jgi:hypothetical protein
VYDILSGGRTFMLTSCWTRLNVAEIIAWEAIILTSNGIGV